jgi:hypothetical protein
MITMCQHQQSCPSATAPDVLTARVVVTHYEQGWSRLCNGIVVFDDLGALLPDGRSVEPGHTRPDSARPDSARPERASHALAA